MMKNRLFWIGQWFVVLMVIMLLASCGGGSSGSGDGTPKAEFNDEDSGSNYSISGTVSLIGGNALEGATITLSGSNEGTGSTDADGDFIFNGLTNGTYTVIPSLAGYTFTPESQSITIDDANAAYIFFNAEVKAITPPFCTFSGSVTTNNGLVLQGVNITTSPEDIDHCDIYGTSLTRTDSNGCYDVVVNNTWSADVSYTITPALAGYTFLPESQTVIDNADTTDINFTAILSSDQWTYALRGDSGSFKGIWGSSGDNIFVVGIRPSGLGSWGISLNYNSEDGWGYKNVHQCQEFKGIWGSSDDNIYGIGHYGGENVYHLSEYYTWTRVEGLSSLDASAIWGSSDTDIFIVGRGLNDPSIEHYDGIDWVDMPCPTLSHDNLYAVWGSASNDVYAAGDLYEKILHYDGIEWSIIEMDVLNNGFPQFFGIWGSSNDNVFMVGDRGTIINYNGNSWSVMRCDNTYSTLRGIWGSSSVDIFAVGDEGCILHYDGTVWSIMNSGTTSDLLAVWGSSADDVYAVGDDGTVLHYGQ